MGSVGAERMREIRVGATADVLDGQVGGLAQRDGGRDGRRRRGCTEEEDLAGPGYLALGSEEWEEQS